MATSMLSSHTNAKVWELGQVLNYSSSKRRSLNFQASKELVYYIYFNEL